MTTIAFLARMDPEEVKRRIDRFSVAYKKDWKRWQNLYSSSTITDQRAVSEFGSILRRWQACRPRPMRGPRYEATHAPPFLDDLVEQASPHVAVLESVTVRDVDKFSASQLNALSSLWLIFYNLTTREHATCVGITKAVMLLTLGRIGPAFDRVVRGNLKAARPTNSQEWLDCLGAVCSDIKSFESKHRCIVDDLVGEQWMPIHAGRVYDMVAGPA